ncbi:MAG: type II toxin-antitoxin system VapC family toxin [Chloroflexi bacterium]|nr:type II toxin-antitoxin system VapC family toxin [Chloroflexota bacterium]
MNTQFVDTNVFLRFLTRDHPKRAEACLALFQKAQRNEVRLTTAEAIIAEVVYVLASKQLYNLTPEEIRARLYPLLSMPGLKLPYRRMYLRALDLYASQRLDFEDALAIAHMERLKIGEIISYDREFDRVAGLQRIEP